MTQQEQFTPLHWQRVKLKMKALVVLVSFLVQLQFQVTTLVVALVTFLQVQFSLLSEGSRHMLVLLPVVGLVPLLFVPLLVPLVAGLVLLVLLGLVLF